MINIFEWRRALLVGLALCAATTGLVAQAQTPGSKTVGGVTVYLGVVPAAITREPGREHHEATMHGAPDPGVGEFHVMAALFEQGTGRRISDAAVTGSVAPLGAAAVSKPMEPMTVAGMTTYGNYFPMYGPGPFRIAISIRRPGTRDVVEVQFEHRHR